MLREKGRSLEGSMTEYTGSSSSSRSSINQSYLLPFRTLQMVKFISVFSVGFCRFLSIFSIRVHNCYSVIKAIVFKIVFS